MLCSFNNLTQIFSHHSLIDQLKVVFESLKNKLYVFVFFKNIFVNIALCFSLIHKAEYLIYIYHGKMLSICFHVNYALKADETKQ